MRGHFASARRGAAVAARAGVRYPCRGSMQLINLLEFAILVFSIILHELAHGGVAFALGDPTAKNAGRLTLNPIPHIDLLGSILLPLVLLLSGAGILIGWAKPVPVDVARFRNPRRGFMLVGAAGPAANLAIACLAAAAWKALQPEGPADLLLKYTTFINVVLAVFNLVPIPPLDGSRIVMGLLPRRLAYEYGKLERYGMLIVLALVVAGGFRYVVWPIVDLLRKFVFA